MFIGQFQNTVIIAVDRKPKCSQHQYTPEIHAGATIVAVHVLGNSLLQNHKNFLSQLWSGVDMLKAAKYLGYVVARAFIEATSLLKVTDLVFIFDGACSGQE